jgi:hypothetical protein
MRRSLIGAALGAAMISGAVLAPPALAAPAQSASPLAGWCGWTPANNSNVAGTFNNTGVNIRSGQYTTCAIVGEGYNGHDVSIRCYAYGTSVNGNTLWLYITDRTTGVTGWSAGAYMWATGGLIALC